MEGRQDTYREVLVFKKGNTIVRVSRPDLAEDERARRMKQLYKAAEELLKDVSRSADSGYR